MSTNLSPDARDYYEGGYRVSLGGVPCRVARKPTKHMLAIMRDEKPLDPVAAQIAVSNIDAPNFAYSKDDDAQKLLAKKRRKVKA